MLKQMVIGVLSAIKRMVNIHTRVSTDPMQQELRGASNTSAPIRGGKDKSQDAQEQPQSAPQKPKRKPKAAQSTKPAASRKPKQKPARPAAKASGASGKQPATRASKTRQHAK